MSPMTDPALVLVYVIGAFLRTYVLMSTTGGEIGYKIESVLTAS